MADLESEGSRVADRRADLAKRTEGGGSRVADIQWRTQSGRPRGRPSGSGPSDGIKKHACA